MMLSRLTNRILPSRSFAIQVATAGALAATSDVAVQILIEKKERHQYDIKRTARFALITSCLMAPIQYNWFKYLDRIHGKVIPTGVKRMLIDQTFAAPILTTTFIFSLNFFQSRNVDYAAAQTRNLIVPVMITNYKIWPIVQTLNMSVVPLHYRVVFLQTVAIFWNMYLSYMTNSRELSH
ncbi:Mpv17 protein [Aphelenchoides avenae]|nr:Mpv17 protein [Aphelenchus avenae]